MKAGMITTTVIATLFGGGVAMAQNAGSSAGDTSGAAAGGNVNPSTAVQKNQGRSAGAANGAAAGSPGVEGAAGSKSGATQTGKHKNNEN